MPCFIFVFVADVEPHIGMLQQMKMTDVIAKWQMVVADVIARWQMVWPLLGGWLVGVITRLADSIAIGQLFYFILSSAMLNRTSSQMCGRWYLPMFLFRDGLMTLIYRASLIVLMRLWYEAAMGLPISPIVANLYMAITSAIFSCCNMPICGSTSATNTKIKQGNNIYLLDTIEVIASASVVYHLPQQHMARTSAKA